MRSGARETTCGEMDMEFFYLTFFQKGDISDIERHELTGRDFNEKKILFVIFGNHFSYVDGLWEDRITKGF